MTDKIGKQYKGRCYIYRDDQSSDVDVLLQSAEDVVRRYNCKVLVLDNLMTMSDGNTEDELVEQKNIMKKVTAFAVKFDVAILLVCHLRKEQAGSIATLESISGTAKLGNLCHRNLTLRRITPEERNGTAGYKSPVPQELLPMDVLITCSKDRLRGRTGSIGAYFDKASRRFYTNEAEYSRQYSWDKTVYSTPIPYPHANDEAFGNVEGSA